MTLKIIFVDLPLGQLPILKVDGETFVQSVAIMRFAAAQAGLPALDPVQELRSNMLVDTMTEIFDKTVGPAFAAANAGHAEGKSIISSFVYGHYRAFKTRQRTSMPRFKKVLKIQ